MAFDDPIVWILIAAVVIFLFGAGQIPKFARSIGQARREFNEAMSSVSSTPNTTVTPSVSIPVSTPASSISPPPTIPTSTTSNRKLQTDPLILAAQKEGIDTQGKSREQIASELSFKLNKT